MRLTSNQEYDGSIPGLGIDQAKQKIAYKQTNIDIYEVKRDKEHVQ